MDNIEVTIVNAQDLLKQNLNIPIYQRPYKWQEQHVNQLIDDLIFHSEKPEYRLGTVVLNNIDGKFDIVDGQQRTLTLTLLCKILDNNFSSPVLNNEFTFEESINNLKHNAKVIEQRLQSIPLDKKIFLDFILNKAEFVQVTLNNNVSEAFQFFDSQNSRGKSLEPHDLLKAFHLREMMDISYDQQRKIAVDNWEEDIEPKDNSIKLNHMMGDFLFRLRQWIERESAIHFSRDHLEVFKGINLKNNRYNYAQTFSAINYAINNYNQDHTRSWDNNIKNYPFQVAQTIENGQRFFEYIHHYKKLHAELFTADNAIIKKFFTKETTEYPRSYRVGDQYVKNLFMCVLIYYYDKFGNIDLDAFINIAYYWSYKLRAESSRISMNTVNNYARSHDNLFQWIRKATYHYPILNYPIRPLSDPQNLFKAPEVIAKINQILGENNQ